MATDTQNPPAGPATYTMRGEEYPCANNEYAEGFARALALPLGLERGTLLALLPAPQEEKQEEKTDA